jgi:hypothetical protein
LCSLACLVGISTTKSLSPECQAREFPASHVFLIRGELRILFPRHRTTPPIGG